MSNTNQPKKINDMGELVYCWRRNLKPFLELNIRGCEIIFLKFIARIQHLCLFSRPHPYSFLRYCKRN